MKKPLSFRQRLMLSVNKAATMETRTSFPYGMAAYVKAAVSTQNKRLSYDWR